MPKLFGKDWTKFVPMYAPDPIGIAEGHMNNRVVCEDCGYTTHQTDYQQASSIASKHMIKTGHTVRVQALSYHVVRALTETLERPEQKTK